MRVAEIPSIVFGVFGVFALRAISIAAMYRQQHDVLKVSRAIHERVRHHTTTCMALTRTETMAGRRFRRVSRYYHDGIRSLLQQSDWNSNAVS